MERIDLAKLRIADIVRRIREYERKYGKPLEELLREVDLNEADVELLEDVFIWEELEKELRRRLSARILELDFSDVAELSEAFSPLRARILHVLSRRGRMRVTDIARELGVSVSSVSKSLKILKKYGFVTEDRAGREAVYSLSVREIVIRPGRRVANRD